jgi:hypothetical protein
LSYCFNGPAGSKMNKKRTFLVSNVNGEKSH